MIDANGESASSMRKLAIVLGVDPMAIYHHHANKPALIHAVMEAMMDDYDIPDPSGTWQRDVRNLCASTRRLALKHPGAFSIYETYRHRVAAEHRLHEAFHSTLLAAGFPRRIAVQSVRVLLAYTEAFAVDEISGWLDSDDQAELLDSFGQGPYPTLINLGEEIACSDPDDDFEFGLNVLIRGLETHSS